MTALLQNMKVGSKLLLSFGLLALMSVAVGLIGGLNIVRLQQMDQDLYRYQTLPLLELRVIHGSFEQNRALMRDMLLETDPARLESHLQAMNTNNRKIDQSLQVFAQSLLTEEEKRQFAYLVNVLENFGYHGDQVIELCRMGNRQFAQTVLLQDGPKLSANFSAAIDKLSQIKEQTGRQAAEINKRRAETAIWLTAILVLAAGALAFTLGMAIAKLIGTPLAAVAGAAKEMGSGNLTCRVPVKHLRGKDEISQLGLVFNSMIENISGLIQQLHESAEMVAASAEELSANAGHTAQVIGEVAFTVSQTADGSQTQVTALSKALTTVEQMSAGIRQIAANSATATATAAQAAEAALTGGKTVDMVIAKMAKIRQEVDHSAAVVTELGARSGEIGQIVATISGLAAQTNLLALNAAIEAARAGEQGRGFAVVAEEVRKLAEQSQRATKQITDLIHSIQVDTVGAIGAMQAGTRQVHDGSEVVTAVGEAFASISGLVRTVSEQIREIAAAVKHMNADSQHIVDAIAKVEQISRQTSSQTQTVSAATQEQSAAMQEITASCSSLAQLADQLQQAVNRFQISETAVSEASPVKLKQASV